MFRSRWPLRRRVLINLTNGDAVGGLLIDQDGPLLVLADASLVTAGTDNPAGMDGHVYIERDRIAFLQAMAPKG